MSMLAEKLFWRTSLYSGVGITVLVAILTLLPGFPVAQWLSRAAGWFFVVCGLVLIGSLIALVSKRKTWAMGLVGGVILALVMAGIVGSIVGIVAMIQGVYA